MAVTTAYNEKTLLQQVSGGDERAFERLYTNHLDFLYGFILKYVKSPDLAEDLTQETFIRLWENRTALAEVESFKNYLFIAGRNITFNFLKRASRENIAKGEILHHYRPSSGEVADKLIMKEYTQWVQTVLNSLPPQTREVFRLCREQNKTYEEVAAILGISRNTVKKHMVRSHKNFTDLLGKKINITLIALILLLQNP